MENVFPTVQARAKLAAAVLKKVEENRQRARSLKAAGYSNFYIAEQMDISVSSVINLLKEDPFSQDLHGV